VGIAMLEIERKFLVSSQIFKTEAFNKFRIIQGFLNTDKERTIRVRLKAEKGFLTIKGLSSVNGLSRFEWEKEISKTDAEALFKLCEKGIIDKMRYEVKVGTHIFEVDEFFGDNEGLIIAEVELASEEEMYSKPDWLGEEVTGDIKYYNSQLSKLPYKKWYK
jgi:CYTH domain-containing protein